MYWLLTYKWWFPSGERAPKMARFAAKRTHSCKWMKYPNFGTHPSIHTYMADWNTQIHACRETNEHTNRQADREVDHMHTCYTRTPNSINESTLALLLLILTFWHEHWRWSKWPPGLPRSFCAVYEAGRPITRAKESRSRRYFVLASPDFAAGCWLQIVFSMILGSFTRSMLTSNIFEAPSNIHIFPGCFQLTYLNHQPKGEIWSIPGRASSVFLGTAGMWVNSPVLGSSSTQW